MLDHLELTEGIGPACGLIVLQDLGSWRRVHLPLFDLLGNWGSVAGDPMADPGYTEVRLSPLGELALACEEHKVGPVPIGLSSALGERASGRTPSARVRRGVDRWCLATSAGYGLVGPRGRVYLDR